MTKMTKGNNGPRTRGKSVKKLYRSQKNRVITGVCGGIGEYFNIDPVAVRLLWIVAIFFMGSGVFAYLIAWLIIPEKK